MKGKVLAGLIVMLLSVAAFEGCAEKKPSILEGRAKSKEIARDGTFIKYATGVVKYTKTGLDEWFAGPDRDTSWNEAKDWVQNMTVDGGGWRMPTIEELRTLYMKGAGTHNMSPLLRTTGWFVWSSETLDSWYAWSFDFNYYSKRWDVRKYSYYRGRAFAVRSRK